MEFRGWIGLAAGAMALAGCQAGDRSFDTVIHRDPGTVAAELGNIDTSEASSLLPETQVLRSQPGENQLLYTVPGDSADKTATIRFDLAPQAGGAETRVAVHLHLPRITLTKGKDTRQVSAAKVESLLHAALNRLGRALDHHDSASAARNDLSMLLVALAVTSHPDLFARLDRNPDAVAGDAMRRLMDGGGFGEPAMHDTGTDPNSRGEGSFGTPRRDDAPGGIDARPMDEARGTDPNPQ